jgi:uncharacterized protein
VTSALVRFILAVFLGVLCLSQQALAYAPPPFQGDVLDEAGLLSEADRSTLLQRIRQLRENGGIWAAICITRSLQGDSIENAAVATFEQWQLGSSQRDNGLLILIAPNERQIRIETGYGLEGQITNALSRRVIQEIYQPAFRATRFADGLMQGFDVLARAVGGEIPAFGTESPTSKPNPAAAVDVDWSGSLTRFLAVVALNLLPAVLYVLARAYGRAKGRRVTDWGGDEISTAFIVFGFLGVFFGIFFAVFGAAFAGDTTVVLLLTAMNLLFASFMGVPLALKARRYLSASAYRRWQARERLMRIRKRSGAPRNIFGVWFDPSTVAAGSGGIQREPRSSWGSSSSSSGSDSSSSSGGGRSGGGGASGSW